MEKYEIPLGCVRFKTTPASTAAPSPSESGNNHCTTMFVKKFHGTVLCVFSLNDPSYTVYFWYASALIIYNELRIDPQDIKAWKYLYNFRFDPAKNYIYVGRRSIYITCNIFFFFFFGSTGSRNGAGMIGVTLHYLDLIINSANVLFT